MLNNILKSYAQPASITGLVLLCVMSMHSCIGVEFGYVDEGDGAPEGFGTSEICPEFSWSHAEGEDNPARMTVAMARKTSEVHYVWDMDSMPGEDGSLPVKVVRSGDYCAAAFNVPGTYAVDGLDKFRSDRFFPMTSMRATLPAADWETLNSVYGISSSEFAPEFAAVESAEPLWHAYMEQAFTPGLPSPGTLSFTPEDLTVEIGVKIKIRTVSDAQISSVAAALTGVPSSVSLMSGEVTESGQKKAVFNMSPEANGQEQQYTVYSGKVRTLGIFTSWDGGSYLAGPGILWIAVDAVSGGVERRLYKGINVRYLLSRQEIMEKVERGAGYRVIKNTAEIEIGSVLTVDGNMLSGGDGAVDKASVRLQ
ncbi:MAG: hypothetical protein NC308_06990 [Clostridium sp.]|nr:hypothetical protein [Bacteroides sp.]MCM1198617.1 hypothetical protein [Clostridium sp.]